MRSLVVTDTAVDLTNGAVPFLPNYTVVALNATAAEEILQSCDTIAGTYATIATVPVGQAVNVVINKPFLKLASAGSLVLLGN